MSVSRVAKQPVELPAGVEVTLSNDSLQVKGSKGTLSMPIHQSVTVKKEKPEGSENEALVCSARDGSAQAKAMSGTTRALMNNMVIGVSKGFTRELVLKGVGYRVQVQGNKLNLTLGLSHPVVFELPEGVKANAPSQTQLVLEGADKQALGQAAAKIRALRPPEPYKGKGIRYADERIVLKETKKK